MPANNIPLDRLGLTEAAEAIINASVDTIAQEQEINTEELVAKAKERNLPVVYILREQYKAIDPAIIRQQENEHHCVLVPVDRYEMERVKADAVPYTTMPHFPIPEPPEIFLQPSPYGSHRGKLGGNKTPKIPPKDYAKKKKAKRKMQKQSRRKR